jgi:glycosyltransferase involved in cell wall biosynthesis
MAKVSVVIPAYQHRRFVEQSIRSVLNQTYEDFEIVITDDGSNDGTADVIKGINDQRIKLNIFPNNRGASIAMNDAILRSSGEYIAVLNSDDFWENDKLRKQIEFLESNRNCSAVFCLPTLVKENNEIITEHPWYSLFSNSLSDQHHILRKFFFDGNFLCHPSAVLKRAVYEQIGLYDARLSQLPDFDMWIRLVSNLNIHIMSERMIFFRVLDGDQNASAASPGALIRDMFEFEMVLRHFKEIPDDLFTKIFEPEIKEFKLSEFSRTVSLGWLAASVSRQSHQAYGLKLLFQALDKNLKGIDSKLFRELLTQCDPYRIKHQMKMQNHMAIK